MVEVSDGATLEGVLTALKAGVYVIGSDGGVVEAVGATGPLSNGDQEVAPEEILGDSAPSRVRASVREVLDGGGPTRVTLAETSVGPVAVRLSSLDGDTAEGRVLAVVEDAERASVAEEGREQDAEDLRAVQERLDLALSKTDTGIWEWNLETDEITWSPTLERLAGLEPGEFEGTFEAFEKFAHPGDLPRVEELLEAAIESGEFYQTEFRLLSADGGERWLDARGQVIDMAGEPRRMVGIVTDVTERMEQERELERREQQFRGLVERLPEAYYTVDSEWTITYCNDVVERRIGQATDDLIGTNLWEHVPALRDTPVEAAFREVMNTGTPASSEHYFESYGYWAEIQAYPHEDGIAVVSTDITDQKRQLETVVDFAPLILFRIDENGVFRESRGRALAKLGLEPGEVEGVSALELYADQPAIIDGIERALGGQEFRGTIEIQGLVFELQFSPRHEDGQVTEIIGVAMDVTELERQREQLVTLNEATDDLLYASTTETAARRIVETGAELLPETQAVFWVESGDALKPLAMSEGTDDVIPEDMERQRIPADSWEMETFRSGELRRVQDYASLENRGDTTGRVGSAVLVPLGDHGMLTFARSTPKGFDEDDVTVIEILSETATAGLDAAEREEALETYKNRLMASNERLEQFAYVASHDLQEPLRTVANFADLLVDEYGEDFPDEADRYVEVVTTGCQRMQSMITGLLDYSRVTTRGDEFVPIESGRAIEDVAADLGFMLEETGGRLTWDEDLPTVEADPDQLRQLFQNLVKNALEHAGEQVSIHVHAVEEANGYRFEVEDDGSGIEPNRREKIFRIFNSGEQYHTADRARGIGLAICENIVQRHGGDIWVESEPGQGSTFIFTLHPDTDHAVTESHNR